MTLKNDILSDVNDVFLDPDEFADQVTYTPKGQASKQINMVVELEGEDDVEDHLMQLGTAWAAVADFQTQEPQYGDEIIWQGITLTVTRILSRDTAMYSLEVGTNVRPMVGE